MLAAGASSAYTSIRTGVAISSQDISKTSNTL